MKENITNHLVEEHKLILRMLTVLEKNATLTAEGKFHDYGFFLEAVEFIRKYADKFHHAKEEDILFEALVANGMPRENSPVAAMLMEHDAGRNFVRQMEEAAKRAIDGLPDQDAAIAENALGYVELLRGHIEREDGILYPLAERVIPEDKRHTINEAYLNAEAQADQGLEAHYRSIVEKYEAIAK